MEKIEKEEKERKAKSNSISPFSSSSSLDILKPQQTFVPPSSLVSTGQLSTSSSRSDPLSSSLQRLSVSGGLSEPQTTTAARTIALNNNNQPAPMSPAELHSGLLTIINGTSLGSSLQNILVIDVRPMESYVGGHIKWRRIRKMPMAASGSNIVESNTVMTGLVHIEPDWLHEG